MTTLYKDDHVPIFSHIKFEETLISLNSQMLGRLQLNKVKRFSLFMLKKEVICELNLDKTKVYVMFLQSFI